MTHNGEEAKIAYLGKGLRVVGDVLGTVTLVCAGEIEGRVDIDGRVQIAPEGRVWGSLRAREAEIAGAVEGDVVVGGRLILQATCRVTGYVVTSKLVIERGALLDGRVQMRIEKAPAVVESQEAASLVAS